MQSFSYMARALPNNTGSWVFWSLLTVLFCYHLFTLDISPLPWFDETFFASITHSYKTSSSFHLSIAPYAYTGEILMYGPLYFWITNGFTQLFGFDIFSFRLTGVLFGFCCLLLYYAILRLYFTRSISYLTVGALALDSLFNANMHAGRMETTALFFILMAVYLFLRASAAGTSRKTVLWSMSGASFSLALLTTPRAGFILIALLLVQLLQLYRHRRPDALLPLLAFGLSLSLPYLLWIVVAFGSITGLIAYYAGLTEYLGGGFLIPPQQLPLVMTTGAALLAGLVLQYRIFLSELLLLSVFSLLCFYTLVNDTGHYSTFIMPFQYAILAAVTVLLGRKVSSWNRWLSVPLQAAPLALMLCVSTAFFLIKMTTMYISADTRDQRHITAFIQAHIPAGSRVVGDELYFYAVRELPSDFQYIHLFQEDSAREQYQRHIYDYNYVIWSERLQQSQPELLEVYRANSTLVEVGSFHENRNKNIPWLAHLLSTWHVPVNNSYNCTIYRRIGHSSGQLQADL